MNIVSFFHPQRTFLPCSGVGRHINNILPDLATRPAVDLQLLFSRKWIGADGKLLHFEVIGYVIVGTSLAGLLLVWRLHRQPAIA